MKETKKKGNLFIIVKCSLFVFLLTIIFNVLLESNSVYADVHITPTFSFTQPNSSSTKITVHGDPDSAVGLHYGNQANLSNTIGSTDNNGYLTTSVSSSSYSISCGNTAYVSVGSLRSETIPWSPVASTCANLSLNQTSLSLSKGQSSTIFATDNINISIASTSNSSIVNSNIIGNRIYLTAANIGTTNLIICAENNVNLCATVPISVSATGTVNNIKFSQNNIILNVGDSQTITMSSVIVGSYYISINSNPSNVAANINNNTINLHALLFGSSTITVCQNNGGCGLLYISVVNTQQNQKPTTSVNVVPDGSNTININFTKTFVTNLKFGSKGAEVRSLQSKLKNLKFYSGKIDGIFGASTEKAVKAFQKAHNLEQPGNTGPQTRALLNK